MKRKSVFLVIAFLAIGLVATVAVVAQTGGNSSVINVNFVSLDYADYASRIDIRLDQQVNLVERDITFTPEDAVEIDMIQRPDVGRVSVFLIVKKEQVITVTIKKEGYTFSPASRTVDLSPPIEEEWDY